MDGWTVVGWRETGEPSSSGNDVVRVGREGSRQCTAVKRRKQQQTESDSGRQPALDRHSANRAARIAAQIEFSLGGEGRNECTNAIESSRIGR